MAPLRVGFKPNLWVRDSDGAVRMKGEVEGSLKLNFGAAPGEDLPGINLHMSAYVRFNRMTYCEDCPIEIERIRVRAGFSLVAGPAAFTGDFNYSHPCVTGDTATGFITFDLETNGEVVGWVSSTASSALVNHNFRIIFFCGFLITWLLK